ncbi:MAG: TrkH family potassium uptake protein [Treponemataceae bacterium]
MNFLTICRLISVLLVIISATFCIPLSIAFFYNEFFIFSSFIKPIIATWIFSIVLTLIVKKRKVKLSIKSGFAVVASCWIFSSLLGALPFYFSGFIPHFTDAFFEAASGFTTTGATILSDIESLPRSLNVWRTQMHWLGGMGIVTLTVALMPLLGVGGFQLIKAETTGPEKSKITPKIAVTAKILWFIYVGMTFLQVFLLMLAGMDFVDALTHSFATLGTGGFSSRNTSIGSYNSATIDWICTVFMFLAGINFSLYFLIFRGKIKDLKHNTELWVYIKIILLATGLLSLNLLSIYGNFFDALRHAAFQVISITTTTGFATADFTLWPSFSQMILFFLMFIGGCSGSTGGSIKVIRWIILAKQFANEKKRMLHPHGIYSIHLNGRAGRKDIVFSVAAFIYAYFSLVIITAIVASLSSADLFSSFTASLAIVGNIGPGFGLVGPVEHYGFFNPLAKWWFSFAMIAGRLELYTMVIFLSPSFWKR